MLAALKVRAFPFLSDGSLNVSNFCFIASVRVKQEPVSQFKHEPNDSAPTRFRSETYDAPETSIGKFTKGEPAFLRSRPHGYKVRRH
jgi:hypothetical protein